MAFCIFDIMFDTLNSVIQNMVGLLSQSPEAFNGTLYDFAKGLNSVFQATGLALVVLFFLSGCLIRHIIWQRSNDQKQLLLNLPAFCSASWW